MIIGMKVVESQIMEDIVILEWTFSPPNFFEEPMHITHDKYDMAIENGKVEARIKSEVYYSDPEMRDKIHNSLNNRFLGVQPLTHTAYKLPKPSMYRLYPDGRKKGTLFPNPCRSSTSMGSPDFIQKDRDGNIIRDSRRERIDKKKRLSELTEKYIDKNQIVYSLINSYAMSIREPNNELIHLYEIREALSKHFGGKSGVYKALGISVRDNRWSRIGKLANNEPLKQGRHRGQSIGALRNATEEELKEARNIAQSFVEGYLEYLEKQSQ